MQQLMIVRRAVMQFIYLAFPRLEAHSILPSIGLSVVQQLASVAHLFPSPAHRAFVIWLSATIPAGEFKLKLVHQQCS